MYWFTMWRDTQRDVSVASLYQHRAHGTSWYTRGMKSFSLQLFTTVKNGDKKDNFPSSELPAIIKTINGSIRGAKIGTHNVTYIKPSLLTPRLTKEKKIDMNWFGGVITGMAKTKGRYTIVALHMTDKDRKAYGIKQTLNGTYRTDADEILEFWICANRGEKARHYKRYSEFRRLFMHELLHGFYRHTGVDTEHVHFFDYKVRDVELGLKVVNFKA